MPRQDLPRQGHPSFRPGRHPADRYRLPNRLPNRPFLILSA
jgi:hypothetical protein